MTRTQPQVAIAQRAFRLPASRTRPLPDDNAPIVMIVCGEPERLREMRIVLRSAGFLTAAARSPAAALALLTQIQVDGCVTCQPLDEPEAAAIARILERMRPGCPKVQLPEAAPEASPGWSVCDPRELTKLLGRHFNGKAES